MELSNRKMDQLDQKLLAQLQVRGFQKSSTLAKGLSAGERTIHRRISAMKSKGLIKIVAVPNPVLLGCKGWAKIGIRVERTYVFSVARELVKHPSVYFVAYSLGTFDIIIAVQFDTIERLSSFVNSDLNSIKGVLSTETMLLMYPRKYYNFSWPAPLTGETGGSLETSDSPGNYKVDETDRRIISVLKEDGLLRPKTVKTRLRLGESTVRKRIRSMLKAGAFTMEVVPNPEVLGSEVWATMGVTTNHQFAHEVIDTLLKHPAVYLAAVSLGRFNIILSARFHNIDQLHWFINGELSKIEGVSSIETLLHSKPLKYHSITWPDSLNRGSSKPSSSDDLKGEGISPLAELAKVGTAP